MPHPIGRAFSPIGLRFVLPSGCSLATLRALDYNRFMSTVSTTLAVGDEASGVIARLLKGFPPGSRVRVAITEDEPMKATAAEGQMSLEAFRRRIVEARNLAPRSPWPSTEEAMKELREGERA